MFISAIREILVALEKKGIKITFINLRARLSLNITIIRG